MNENVENNKETLTEDELLALLSEENQNVEFKSSKITDDNLGNKISKAASAFWNSGGGYFIIGVDDNGKIDGGLPQLKGRKKTKEWIEQKIKLTTPTAGYNIYSFSKSIQIPEIGENNAVFVIKFEVGDYPPYMAEDCKYYARFGAESYPISHFMVEGLLAKRLVQNPVVRGFLKVNENQVIQLVITTANNAPIFDAQFNLSPVPQILIEHDSNKFPLFLPFISQEHPFVMDIASYGAIKELYGGEKFHISIKYKNILGKNFEHEQTFHPSYSKPMYVVGPTPLEKIYRVLKEITSELKILNRKKA